MAYNLIIKPVVIVDAEDALKYYNSKIDGLGQRFYSQFLLSLSKIQKAPYTFSYAKKPVRRCRVQKFPYKIFYTISAEVIIILGVTHEKRSNAFIRRRLRLL